MPNAFVSFLKKVGQDALIVLGWAVKVETAVAPVIIAFDPAAAPLINIANTIAAHILKAEEDFALVGRASDGPGKLAAAVAASSNAIDSWIAAGLPGSAKVADALAYANSKTALVNAVVAMLNSFGPSAAIATNLTVADAIITTAAAKSAGANIPAAPTA